MLPVATRDKVRISSAKKTKVIFDWRLGTPCHRPALRLLRSSAVDEQQVIRDEILRAVSPNQLRHGLNASQDQAIKGKVDQLVARPLTDLAAEALEQGQGSWEVIYAPHIAKLSKVLGTTFAPIQYILRGNTIISNVHFSNSLFREGWLSASGTIDASGVNTLQILFNRFWLDFGSKRLRRELPDDKVEGFLDTTVMALGKLGFISQFSYFPVLYMDPDGRLAVLSFPPLKSKIVIRREQ